MNAAIQPLQLLLLSVAGWMGRRQQEVIEYLVEENLVLKEQLGGRRLRLTDDQRRRLAAKGNLMAVAFSTASPRSSRPSRPSRPSRSSRQTRSCAGTAS